MSAACLPPVASTPQSAPAGWTVERLEAGSTPDWDRMALDHPDCSVFHLSGWARVLRSAYGHESHYLVCRRPGGELAALVPFMELRNCLGTKRGVSLPFADFCPPLLFGEKDGDRVFPTVRSVALQRGWKSFELRGGTPPVPFATASVAYCVHSLDLAPGPEALSAGFDASFRQAVRKAEREGVVSEIRTDESALRAYYQLHVRTRRRHGSPPQPWSFFQHLWKELIQPGQGILVLGQRRGCPVAGAVFLHTGHQAVFKFGASDERLPELRANNLVMAAAIRHLAERGLQSLHFGRTSLHQSGLRRFKRGWGAVESTLSYFKYDLRRDCWTVGADRAAGWQKSLFSRLPQSVNRLAGRLLYPHLD
jgi:hypothetical protein